MLGRWIQAFDLKFPTRTYGLSINYDAYFACGHLRNQKSTHYALSDGELAGVPYSDLCALCSLTIKLAGKRARYYEVKLWGQMVEEGGKESYPVRWKKGGEALQVENGPAFNYASPATWIQQIEVHVTKRDPKTIEAE
jgi:hypothetical protein